MAKKSKIRWEDKAEKKILISGEKTMNGGRRNI